MEERKMMTNFRNIPGVPHKGWSLDTVYDIRDDGQTEEETNYEACMMCGNEKIRYVHVLSHPEYSQQMKVGCNCAEKMTDDYINPTRYERNLRNKSARRQNWLKTNWKFSRQGDYYLKRDGHILIIFIDKRSGLYQGKIDNTFGRKKYKTVDLVKVALFNGIEYLKSKGQW
ncbi:MAG: hypothetical protein ABJ004_12365 [Cyclobacteriaceae bacterium]